MRPFILPVVGRGSRRTVYDTFYTLFRHCTDHHERPCMRPSLPPYTTVEHHKRLYMIPWYSLPIAENHELTLTRPCILLLATVNHPEHPYDAYYRATRAIVHHTVKTFDCKTLDISYTLISSYFSQVKTLFGAAERRLNHASDIQYHPLKLAFKLCLALFPMALWSKRLPWFLRFAYLIGLRNQTNKDSKIKTRGIFFSWASN